MQALLVRSIDITGLHEGIRGDLSGITGDLSGISGNVDLCELSDEDRAQGVHINELIKLKTPTK